MKFAIAQDRFIKGGRLRWTASLIHYLNERGVCPDVLSYEMDFSESEIDRLYKIPTRFNVRLVGKPSMAFSREIGILCFNRKIDKISDEYDCVINSSNSWIYLADNDKFVHFIHFPKKYRFWHDVHETESADSSISIVRGLMQIQKYLMRGLYTIFDRKIPDRVVANSEFTAGIVGKQWSSDSCSVIYPVSHLSLDELDPETWANRTEKTCVVMGRFVREKRQCEIMNALKDYDGQVSFVGFADEEDEYFRTCKENSQGSRVFTLYPNASEEQKESVIDSSRYYIHATVNEPFGLSTVEALSRGLIPIVHSSGAANEIVDDGRLRYSDYSQLPHVLGSLDELSTDEQYSILNRLRERCLRRFSNDSFSNGWDGVFEDFFPGGIRYSQ